MPYFPYGLLGSKNLNFKVFHDFSELQFIKLAEFIDSLKYPEEFSKAKLFRDKVLEVLSIPLTDYPESFFYMLLGVLDISDTYNEYIEHLKSIISETEDDEQIKSKVIQFLESLNFPKKHYYTKRLKDYKSRGNVLFSGITYGCDLLGRFESDFDHKSVQIEDYKPVLTDVAPIVTIRVTANDGEEDKAFSFQADDEKLNVIILTLLAAQKELMVLKTFCTGEIR